MLPENRLQQRVDQQKGLCLEARPSHRKELASQTAGTEFAQIEVTGAGVSNSWLQIPGFKDGGKVLPSGF